MAEERGTGGVFDFNSAKAAKQPGFDDARLDRLRAALHSRAADLVSQLFPRAHIGGAEARIGNLEGDRGESLSIALIGDKAGLWRDHATDQGGDLIDLWRETSHATFAQAVDDLEHWAGLAHTKRPAWSSPVVKLGADRKAKTAQDAPEDLSLGPPVQTWHYFSADGSTILGKVSRYQLANGKKTYRPFNTKGEMGAPDPRPLYRLPNIRTASTVIFVEGEKCADALASVGFEATSAMQGAYADIDKTDWTPLAGKTVILWADNDLPGMEFMGRVEPIIQALGCTVQTTTIPDDKPWGWDAADAIAAGEEVSDYLPRPTAAPAQRFRILTLAELFNVPAPAWRIDGIFTTHGSSTLYGAFESFKSFVAVDMALCLATGQPWHGRTLTPCNVLYIAGEGQYGLAHRVFGWCAAKHLPEHPQGFRALPEAVAIPHAGDADALLKSIDATGLEFGLIVFDTVTRMANGGSLNDEKDVQAYVRGSDRIRLATGAHVMHIGHSGKDTTKGLMGSVVLPAAMETIICVERRADSLTLINSNPKGKQKDGPNFEDIRLQARVVHFERDGQDATTRILMPDDEVVISDDKPSGPRGTLQTAILDALQLAKAATNSGDRKLGFTRLKVMTGANGGSLSKALEKLEKSSTIRSSGPDGARMWWLD